MSHRNYRRDPVAKELREDGKYKQRIVPDKKKFIRSTKERTKWYGDHWWGRDELEVD